MSDYMIAEDGDPEIGVSWDIYKKDGDRAVRVATLWEERQAVRFLAAIQWLDSLEGGMLSIPTEVTRKKPKPSIGKKTTQKKG